MSKAPPTALSKFANLGNNLSEYQQQQGSFNSSSSSTNQSFRSDASTSRGIQNNNNIDDELGKFAQSSNSGRGNIDNRVLNKGQVQVGSSRASGLNDLESSWINSNSNSNVGGGSQFYSSHEQHQHSQDDHDRFRAGRLDDETSFRNGWQDGDEIQSILTSNQMNQGLDQDWESDLFTEQSRKADVYREGILPKDPVPSYSTSQQYPQQLSSGTSNKDGRASPSSSHLLSKLSSLSLSSQQTLSSTLLSHSSPESILGYLSSNRYTDDIYGLPSEVEQILKEVIDGDDENAEVEDGKDAKSKALKRLQMLMDHLRGQTTSNPSSFHTIASGEDNERQDVTQGEDERRRTSIDSLNDPYNNSVGLLSHISTAGKRPVELGPKRSSAMSTPSPPPTTIE